MAVLRIDGISGFLSDAGVEDGAIEDILSMLSAARVGVEEGSRIQQTPPGAYGGSATAAELGLHAGKAHHHVVDAMNRMADGLEGYRRGVEHFRRDVHETDADQAREYVRRAQSAHQVDVGSLIDIGANCTQSRDFSSDPTCQLPESGDQ